MSNITDIMSEMPEVPLHFGRGELVLLVENDPNARHMTEQRLTAFGYEVQAVGDANSALRAIAGGRRPAAVLSDDIISGGVSGLELGRLLRGACPEMAVLLATGSAGAPMDIGEIDMLRIQVLTKPYRQAELARALRDAIDASGSERSIARTSVQ